ncbi:MAG: beta-ketoacyl synthase N-terminal-like domain-containing protein, partial [Kineosporiaceae bacterium]
MADSTQRKVVVTGLGATTPLAGDLPGSWQAALEGRSGARTITEDWVERYDLPVTFAAQLAVPA